MTARHLFPSPAPGALREQPIRGAALGVNVSTIEVDGARTTYVDAGSGPVVLLLHGAPMTSLAFARVVHELETTHRVIAPDFPGFGGSQVPAGFDGALEAYARFVVSFCLALSLEEMVMYVNDSSACIGIAAATNLSGAQLRGMVVADTVPFPLTGAAGFVRFALRYIVASRTMRWLNRRFNFLPWLVVTVAPWLNPFSRAERRALTHEFDTPEKRERVLDVFEQMATDRTFMRRTAERARARLGRLPTLILYGQFDPMRAVGGVGRFRAMFPTHQVAIIPREEHFPMLSSGAQVARVVRDWMQDLPLRTL